MIDLVNGLSAVSGRVKSSVIRDLLKVGSRPDIISFAGGLPDPDTFPVEKIREMLDKVLKENARTALQYGDTAGCESLREEIVKMFKEDENITIKPENVFPISSSQQGLDLVGKLFINPGDDIIMELPTYIGGLQAFQVYGANMHGIKCDDDGILTDQLESKLKEFKESGKKCKFVYLVPDFQNPSGVTMSEERRKKVVELSKQYNVPIIEDSPYRQTRFEGTAPRMMQSFDHDGNVISLFTFSKILAPGLRLGYAIAHEDVIKKMSTLKQSMDLCTSALIQLLAAEFLKGNHLRKHIPSIVKLYKAKRDVMTSCLKKYMPEGVSWTNPSGGLFLFVKLPEYMNSDEMFHEAIEKKVAYVIGSAFHCDGSGKNTMRFNFSFPTHEQIDEGVKRLAEVIKKNLKAKANAS
ncbi:MAG TPA: PLP-dependent aminotransferase family protein [Elusimicrobiales bacterium]|nr:PLP-dependent aminotransferase family protein [Elusimicrobiales bacterium]